MSGILEVLVPEVGESIAGGQILTWFKQSGETVKAGDPLFELETDKITLTVPAEHSGALTILAPAGADVLVGQVVAKLHSTVVSAVSSFDGESKKESLSTQPDRFIPNQGIPIQSLGLHTQTSEYTSPTRSLPDGYHSSFPSEHSDTTETSGRGVGRILKEISITALQNPSRFSPPHNPSHTSSLKQPIATHISVVSDDGTSVSPVPAHPSTERQSRKRMTPIRKRIAARLVEAQQTAAMLTTFNEVDMSVATKLRQQYQDMFSKKYGLKLGFMSFFVKAVVSALQQCPELNAFIDGDDIVYNHVYDIGIAVGTDRGLIVPVVRNADELGFAQIEMEIANLAKKAKEKKLSLDDLTGGTFSITNGGIYGSLLSTPILNPPQSGILGMHGIKKRPIVVDDRIEIRPMMYLALTYDHRIVDGAEAVTFLRRVCDCIENPERLLFDV